MSDVYSPVEEVLTLYEWPVWFDGYTPIPRHLVQGHYTKAPSWYYYYTPRIPVFWGAYEYFKYGDAPQYGSTTHDYSSKQLPYNQLGMSAAAVPTAAPTQGAYTGIPSGCSASGTSGTPY